MLRARICSHCDSAEPAQHSPPVPNRKELALSRKFLFPLLVIAASVLPVNAQIFDASSAGGPVTISAPWRFSPGDDSRWAKPEFDDSQWSLVRMDQGWNKQGYGGLSGYAWYRIKLKLLIPEP